MSVSCLEQPYGPRHYSRVLESDGAEQDTSEHNDDLHERDKQHSLLIVRLDPCL